MRKLRLLVVKQRDSDRERLVGNRGCNNGRKRGRGRILTEGLRIRRYPCRVVGDGSNRDQLVCKSHVNIAHSPGTEVSEASRSISRSLDMSFSLVSTALVRFHPTPLCFSLSLSDRRASKRRNQSPDKVSADEVVTEFFLIPRPFVFNPSLTSSAAELSTDIRVFRPASIPANLRDTVCRWHSICGR